MKVWLFAGIFLILSATSVHSQPVHSKPPLPSSAADQVESRMELILEFNTISGEYLDRLFISEKPDLAMLEWCEKAELRAMGHSRIQQSFGELYLSMKSCIRGDARKARVAFQQALWLMASERYEIIESTH